MSSLLGWPQQHSSVLQIDPQDNMAENVTWCVGVLLFILFLILIALLVAGTYAAMTYFRRFSDEYYDYDNHKLTLQKQLNKGTVTNHSSGDHLDETRKPLRYSSVPPAPSHDTDYIQPDHRLNMPPEAPTYPYNALTLQQQYVIAQYWQAMYNQYMMQTMGGAQARSDADYSA